MTAGRRTLVVGLAMAAVGVWLAVDAWRAGSLWRYQLAGLAVGSLLCLPLATWLIWRQRTSWLWRRVAFAAVPLLACLLLGELLMRGFGPERVQPAVLLFDARLGHVLQPGTLATDADGWRNAAVRDDVDVLFVGDSQTWGFGVDRDECFAEVFAAKTGASCYQMANGSYGPVQYRELVRRGLELTPKLVVVGFYFGNDLIDAVDYAALDGAEDLRTEGLDYRLRKHEEFEGPRTPNLTMWAIDALLSHSQLLDAVATVVKSRLQGGMLDDQAGAVPFEHATAATILLPTYRLPTVDASNPTVQDGVAIAARCMKSIVSSCEQAGADCVLVTIPSKEFCYAEWRGPEITELATLHAAERATRDQVFRAAGSAGLDVIDITSACIAAMREGKSPWNASGDGHISRTGHQLVADLLRARWVK